ncbi:MAG: glucoamylase family protein [Puia sp.]|nr:glucoamylase family protein [Puia sp.]
MKNTSIQELLSHLRIHLPGDNLMKRYANEKPPLRSELFSADQMAQYGRVLAGRHQLVSGRAPNQLLKRLADNETMLLEVHDLLTDAIKENRRIIPAGEWLLDNFYLIQEQIRTGNKHLPKGYSEDLPQLSNGPSAGLPRVYDIALEIVSHSDGRVDLQSLTNFISSYQTVTHLKLGELWAIPIMLRLALIENLRRLAAQISIDRINQNLADYWAEQMTQTAETDPKSLILVIADMARSGPPMVSSFVAELTRMLQGKGPSLALPLTWIEQRLSETGQTSNELVQAEFQKQAADQVSMSNSIGSLRFLGTTDWREFVESCSLVERTLRKDAKDVYGRMDFTTRDYYRHIVEKIARYSDSTELQVAESAIRFAKEGAAAKGEDDRTAHVGFYLAGRGRRQTEKEARMAPPVGDLLEKFVHRYPMLFYASAIAGMTLIVGGGFFVRTRQQGVHPGLLIAVTLLSLLCASQLAVTLVNWITTLLVTPSPLPRMNFSTGIPAESRTLVVIPTLLGNEQELDSLVEDLEVRFLANRDERLHFGLLTDFKDARQETLPEDEALLQKAVDKIEALNTKYASPTQSIFFLFHRPRRWNERDKIWMGYERKRGKLTEMNSLLRGSGKDRFSRIVGDERFFPEIRYVITLDTDTQLPRDAASKIISVMAHPLNRALYDEKRQRVTDGYGILQPRVDNSLAGSNNSRYARLHGNDVGIDPYTRASSDVYQDLFGEGSFIGKGIYELDLFAKTLNERFPENRILSHDLLEGCYMRSGLLTDVQLYEEYPSRYSADVKRRHRWIRGDWQIGTWFLPFVPNENGRLRKNPLSALSRWKIFDNLRRSLVPTALTALLLLGWTVLHDELFWTVAVFLLIVIPPLSITAWDILNKPKEISLRQHIKDSVHSITNHLIQTAFTILCLPYEAYYTLDAILRTNWRMIVSHKKLLEWQPFRNSKNPRTSQGLPASFLTMWVGPVTGFGVLLYLIVVSPINVITTFILLGGWIASPFVAWWFSRPIAPPQADLKEEQRLFLRGLARKTWSFFETFVTREGNWLPPDNYQEHPVERTAYRTSPTNMGLSLLANLSAWDFGYSTTGQFLERSLHTLDTMQTLERFRGHFYNWYDTQSLQILTPRYVSTVDSGNLTGHLLTLRQGILAIPQQPILGRQAFEGLRDTLSLINDPSVREFKKELDAVLDTDSLDLLTAKASLEKLATLSAKIIAGTGPDRQSEAYRWTEALTQQVKSHLDNLFLMAPWLLLPPVPAALEKLTLPDSEPFSFSQSGSRNGRSNGLSSAARKDSPALENDSLAFSLPEEIPTLQELAGMQETARPLLERLFTLDPALPPDQQEWLAGFRDSTVKASRAAAEQIRMLELMASQCLGFADNEYDFLYEKSQKLLTIGYNVDEHRRDAGYYDLLASEARLGIYAAIAAGKLPQEAWFSLGRQLANAGGESILVSWSGSMVEYLMPLIVMPEYENTLLAQTNHAMVARQIEYGNQRDTFWGISESGYNMVDAQLNYQYRAFGVPGLGLKRGLAEDLVISPYSTVMALMVQPEESCKNLQAMSEAGFEGRYGFYEAIDYTASRLPRGQTHAIIRSFMVHHQGMSLLSLAYLLLDQPMQKRFESELSFQATALLLQERIPKATSFYSPPADIAQTSVATTDTDMRVINMAETPSPEVQLLSNGRYHVMVTHAGGGYSRWRDMAVTRWREDSTCDNWGTFCYIRDVESMSYWSAGHQPTLRQAKSYEAVFSQGRAEFRRRDSDIETHTEIVVSPEDDIEMRRIHLTNRSRRKKTIEITSYAEVVLTSAIADALHPAFSNLFVETEILDSRNAILCTRRPRSTGEACPWMFHLMKAHTADGQEVSYETDRMQFIGRGNTVTDPQSMSQGNLSGTQGSVLDPIVSIRYRITLNPQETTTVDMVFGMGETREISLGLIEKYQDRHLTDRAFELAWTHSQVVLRQINASEADAQLYGRLAGSVIYANAALRADPAILIQNRRGQSGLWSYSISGDLPIVLVQIEDPANIDMVKQMVQAHAYWRLKGLIVDLVIWNEDHGGYRQLLQNQLLGLISAGIETDLADRPGGIFVRVADQISPEDRILLQTVARIKISDTAGDLSYQVGKRSIARPLIPRLVPRQPYFPQAENAGPQPTDPNELQYFNGIGGFSREGHEYLITTGRGQTTPAPWINVLANAQFGTVLSESGQAYTWVENAHEFRLTPWNNDPVSDTGGETFYLRDEESGIVWSPTLLPATGKSSYTTRHGFGYSIFDHTEDGIHSEMQVYVDLEAAIKFTVIKLHNYSGRERKLSLTGYTEWVLGDLKPKSAMHVVTTIDPATGALFARNAYNTELGDRTCFFDVHAESRTFTADRTEFIGRNGSIRRPDALTRVRLSGRTGAALDPCAVLQVPLDLPENGEQTIIFLLGAARNNEEAGNLIRQFLGPDAAQQSLDRIRAYWNKTLGVVKIESPEHSMNLLANGWLLYQTIACRIRARSGYYQSGGAFGFRDQLQDTLAILHTEPGAVREHLLLSASRQFREGDVQHWWHPPTGRGVRTRCSDDYLWLPFVASRYITHTGDTQVLDEIVGFLDGRPLNPEEESYYDLPGHSPQSASLYEHCVRAIRHGLRFGEHGLPLMGSGDWNDGMDKVGQHGKGESVWLGFFLYTVLKHFAGIATLQKDAAFNEECERQAAQLKENLNKNAWDGQWYRRAYFDDGTPLGASTNEECRIDSIAQSWSVLSGAGTPEYTTKGMESADKYLVRRDSGIIQLLDPPFDKSDLDPGYIKGYVPGVRENGGQYTHAAIWLTMAFAVRGDYRRAWELFNMINPIHHGNTPKAIATYKVEPYVMAADVYSIALHKGRGGWTWYTGSAGWTYQLITESLIGLHRYGDTLQFNPCIPPEWGPFVIHYRFKEALYHIRFIPHPEEEADQAGKVNQLAQAEPISQTNPSGQADPTGQANQIGQPNPAQETISTEQANRAQQVVVALSLDSVKQTGNSLPLSGDAREYQVEVNIYRKTAAMIERPS